MKRSVSIMGAPLAGKSTQADALAQALPKIAVVDTGQLLREFNPGNDPEFLEAKQVMLRRGLVETRIVQRILGEELEKRYSNGSSVEALIFCGSPRKILEAHWLLDEMLPRLGYPLVEVYHLDVPVEELDSRRQKRIGREQEDTPEGFAMGMQKYQQDTIPVIEFFEAKGMLVTIDGNRRIDAVTRSLESQIQASIAA